MSEFKDAKITDVYTFYCSTGYVGSKREESATLGEILGYETQDQLDALLKTENPDNYINECLEQDYQAFMESIDCGWYKTGEE